MSDPSIQGQATYLYQYAVQTYGADGADKAAKASGLAGTDQSHSSGRGHLDLSAATLPSLTDFINNIQADVLGQPTEVSNGQAEQLENILSASIAGDTASFLARAMIKLYGQQRHENVLERMQDGLSAQQQLMSAADQLDAEADKMQSAAIVSLVTSVVSAAITIGTSAAGAIGGIKSIKNQMSAMRSEMQATKQLGEIEALDKDVESAEKLGTVTPGLRGDIQRQKNDFTDQVSQAQYARKAGELNQTKFALIGQIGDSTAKLVSAAGEFNSKLSDSDIKHMEADVKRFEAEAQFYQTQGDLAKSRAEALDDMVKQIIAFVHDQQEATSERMRAFTRG